MIDRGRRWRSGATADLDENRHRRGRRRTLWELNHVEVLHTSREHSGKERALRRPIRGMNHPGSRHVLRANADLSKEKKKKSLTL